MAKDEGMIGGEIFYHFSRRALRKLEKLTTSRRRLDLFKSDNEYAFALRLADAYGCRTVIEIGAEVDSPIDYFEPDHRVIAFGKDRAVANRRSRLAMGKWMGFDELGQVGAYGSALRPSMLAESVVIYRTSNIPLDVRPVVKRLMTYAPIALVTVDLPPDIEIDPTDGKEQRKVFADLTDLDMPSRLVGRLNVEADQQGGSSGKLVGVVHNRATPEPTNAPEHFRVAAIMFAHNEADVMRASLEHLIDEGVHVYFIDNWSTDGTKEVAEEYLGRGVVGVETFPPHSDAVGFDYPGLLNRVEEVSTDLNYDWYMRHDADEWRQSPWPDVTLKDAIYWVDQLGFNAIDFTVLDFRPVDDGFSPGQPFAQYFRHYEFGSNPKHTLQIKGWRDLGRRVSLSDSAGHEVRFAGRRVCPFKFLLRHYPIRGQDHGVRKVFQLRKSRLTKTALNRGWHAHYSEVAEVPNFIRDRRSLKEFNFSQFYYENFIMALSGLGVQVDKGQEKQ